MFIDFLHRFVIDHINGYYFRLMTYSIGENQSIATLGRTRWPFCMFQVLDVFKNGNAVRKRKDFHIASGLIASVDCIANALHD